MKNDLLKVFGGVMFLLLFQDNAFCMLNEENHQNDHTTADWTEETTPELEEFMQDFDKFLEENGVSTDCTYDKQQLEEVNRKIYRKAYDRNIDFIEKCIAVTEHNVQQMKKNFPSYLDDNISHLIERLDPVETLPYVSKEQISRANALRKRLETIKMTINQKYY